MIGSNAQVFFGFCAYCLLLIYGEMIMLTVTLSIIYITSIILMSGIVGWILLKANRNLQTYMFVVCQLLIVIWNVGQLVEVFSVTSHQRWLCFVLENISICFIGPFWLAFSLYYSEKKPGKFFIMLLFAIGLGMYGVVLTNSYHHLYYTYFSLKKVSHGFLFYLNMAYLYITMIIGLVMIFVHAKKKKFQSMGQAVLLSLGTGIPLTLNILYLSGIIAPPFETVPLSFAVSSVMVLLATYRYGFLDVNSVALRESFDFIKEGVIIFDKLGKMTYLSSAAKNLLEIDLNMSYPGFVEYISGFSKKNINHNFEYEEISRDGKILSVKCYRIRDDHGKIIAFTVVVSDISRYYELIESNKELATTERKLAIEWERNRIAQEVHDTAGHTFTMITSLSRLGIAALSKIPECEVKNQLGEYLDETQSLSRSGITQLRCSINNLRDGVFLSSVTAAIKLAADALRDVETEICVQGEEGENFVFAAKTVYEICRELVTNVSRYSQAKRMDFIVKFLPERMELYVFDNGKGCKEIKAHNGLGGISKRAKAVGGTVEFHSSEGNGFSTILKIPSEK